MKTHLEFTTTDAEGNEHRYIGGYHSPEDGGVRIALMLGGLGIEPVAHLIKSVLLDSKVEKVSDLANLAVSDILDSIDLGAVGEKIKPSLLSGELVDLPKLLLSGWSRDGKGLGSKSNFDEAYKGNYLEIIKASFEVIKLNRFLPLPNIF